MVLTKGAGHQYTFNVEWIDCLFSLLYDRFFFLNDQQNWKHYKLTQTLPEFWDIDTLVQFKSIYCEIPSWGLSLFTELDLIGEM